MPDSPTSASAFRASTPHGKRVHLKVVSGTLGHSNIPIPLDTYFHVIPGMGDAAAEAMDDALE